MFRVGLVAFLVKIALLLLKGNSYAHLPPTDEDRGNKVTKVFGLNMWVLLGIFK